METQTDQKKESKVKKSTLFTKINTKAEAEKPLKSIRTLFSVLGILVIIGGLAQAQKTRWEYLLIILIALGFIVCSFSLKKYKSLGAAYGLLFLSISAVLILTISMTMKGFNLIAVFFYLLAFFSSIDAIMIIKQVEKLNKIEEAKNPPENES
ncbi:MAG TPA: hypothetical protein VMV47_14965 [Bacteroidales bacterium]|nr:hypothetical protein [Bacteroidales bacterium]